MKAFTLILSGLLAASVAWGADFSKMSTDQLLEKRGTMTTEQERVQLHNELKQREATMTQKQLDKFHTYPPENRVRKYKNQMGNGMGPGTGTGKGMGGKGAGNR